MTCTSTKGPSAAPDAIDIHHLLQKRRQVAVIWSIEDVQSLRPDLNDDESWNVLQQCRKWHDCEAGFTWGWIEGFAEQLYPAPLASDTPASE